ncbi:hypothetical protein AMTRI_Chr06g173530 [Amborella trichopoda]
MIIEISLEIGISEFLATTRVFGFSALECFTQSNKTMIIKISLEICISHNFWPPLGVSVFQGLNVLHIATKLLWITPFQIVCQLPLGQLGDTKELMEQVPYLATPPRNFTEMQDGEPDSSTKLLEKNVPCVGMAFFSKEGFGIRKGTTHNEKSERIHMEILCFKEGFRKAKDQVSGKELPESRCGWKVKLGVTRKADNKWVVTWFIEDHNHDLVSPRKACPIYCHRTLSSATKLMINSMTSAMVKSRHIHDIVIEQPGGIENVTCIQKDIENEIASARRKLRGEDGSLIMQWLYKMKESNLSFFYRLKLDEDDRNLSILWVDATCKVSYQCFSHVVTFDTTYKTNSFSMSFAPILGANHHFNTIFFGFALIFDEKVESFVWAFKNWLEAMGGQ